MAYYPDVAPGDDFVPDATFFNDVRHMINRADGMRAGVEKAHNGGEISVCVYNAGTSTINAGMPVNFPPGTPIGGNAIPVTGFTSADVPWGVVRTGIAPNKIADCIVAGVVTVPVAGTAGHFAVPGATVFNRGSEGVPVLGITGSGTNSYAFVLLGGMASESGGGGGPVLEDYSEYDFGFQEVPASNGTQTIVVNGGWLFCSLKHDEVLENWIVPVFETTVSIPPGYLTIGINVQDTTFDNPVAEITPEYGHPGHFIVLGMKVNGVWRCTRNTNPVYLEAEGTL